MRSITESPKLQKAGSFASRPKGVSGCGQKSRHRRMTTSRSDAQPTGCRSCILTAFAPGNAALSLSLFSARWRLLPACYGRIIALLLSCSDGAAIRRARCCKQTPFSRISEPKDARLPCFSPDKQGARRRFGRATSITTPRYPIASSSPIMRSITERPIFQKPGSFASRPKGASSCE